jgi:hypothetical protein
MITHSLSHPEIYIIAAAFIGAALGTLGTFLAMRPRLRRKQNESWRAANLFYSHKS